MTASRAAAGPRRSGPTLVAAALAALLPGCVTRIVEHAAEPVPIAQGAVVIPLVPAARQGAELVDGYYLDVIAQMREAAKERNRERLASLLDQHDGETVPDWARPHFDGHWATLGAIDFERHVALRGGWDLAAEPVPIGAALELTWRIPPRADVVTRVGFAPNGLALHVAFVIEDVDVFGAVTTRKGSDVLRAQTVADLGARELALPMRILAPHEGSVLRRLALHCELLPGEVELDGERVPYQRVATPEFRRELYPAGVEPIRREPLKTLRAALQLGDAAHWPHQFLACRFMPESQREDASAMLMRLVQLGEPAPRRVAIAGLRQMHAGAPAADDRESWLRWWSQRAK